MKTFATLFWIVLALFGAQAAAAHTRSETHSNWQISGRTVRLAFTVPTTEARRLAPPGQTDPDDARLIAYLAHNVGATADGRACPLLGAPEAVQAVQGVRRFEFTFDCPSDRHMGVHVSAFFDLVPSHTNFAQIQTSDGNFIEELITTDHRDLDVSADQGGGLKSASFFRYIELGILHIFTGIDHQAFLVGLILLSRKFRDLAFVITGFTLGHSLTLALAVTGLLRPHAEYIDALIGLTIALVGAENLAIGTRKPGVIAGCVLVLLGAMTLAGWLGFGGLPTLILVGGGLFSASYLTISGHLRDAARFRLVVTLVFGLVHGFGFAANLLEMQLPKERLAELLVGFNLGVEIGQLTVVVAVIALATLLSRLRLAPPREVVSALSTAMLIGVGLFWFVARSYA